MSIMPRDVFEKLRLPLESTGMCLRSGRTNNVRKEVDESVWAVQLVEHTGKEVMEEK
jgi:hypothetical protein